MAKLVIILEVADVDPALVDPHEVAERVVDTYNDERFVEIPPGHEVSFVSSSWNAPEEFMRPLDHEKRIAIAESTAFWELGSEEWAGKIFTAYEHPDIVRKQLENDGWKEEE